MHFSRLHKRAAATLSTSLLIVGTLAGTAHAAANTYCNPPSGTIGTTTYSGASGGQWGTGDNWSNGQPDAQCDAIIPANTTVTLSTVTQAGSYGNGNGAATDGLTIEPGATVIVEGESSDVQGNWLNATNLDVGLDGLTIDQGATLDIEASNATAEPVQGSSTGGPANVTVDSGSSGPASLTNNGTIVTSSNDAAWGESLNDGGTLTNAGTITDQSGLLTLQGQNYPYVLDNTGSFTIDSGASFTMIAGDGSSFNNTGTFANQGTATLQQSMYWVQDGGSVTGDPVQLTNGETLQDSSGAASFEVDNCTTAGLLGTVPANQTITVLGGCAGTTLYDGGSTSTAPVVNNGTIDLVAPAGGSDALLGGSTLDNYGTVNSSVSGAPPLANQLLVTLDNEAGATVNLTGGELAQTTGSTTTNDGTVNIAAGATWLVQGGAFTNSGTLGLQLASPTNLGTLNLTVGGKFNAGGTLAPTLTAGYQPATGTEFPIVTENGGSPSGSFGSVTGGFTADYSKETASPGYLGIVYGGTVAGGATTTTTTAVRPSVHKLSGGARRLVLNLSCAKSAKSACPYTVTGTVGKKQVASGHGTIKPGKAVTITLKLNKTGTALLRKARRLRVRVLVSAGGKTIKTSTVTVTKAVATKKKK